MFSLVDIYFFLFSCFTEIHCNYFNTVYRVHKYQEMAMSESPLLRLWPEDQGHLHFLGSLSQIQNHKPKSPQLESVG